MECDFVTTAAGDGYRHECRNCGEVRHSPAARYLKICRRPAITLRSDEEQAACMTICRANLCGAYDPVRDACRRCGCQGQRREAWLAKLRVGTCPQGLWPAGTANGENASLAAEQIA